MDASKKSTTPARLLVPRHVRNLNTLAERHGMSTEILIGRYEGESDERLFAVWRGTRAQLESLNLIRRASRLPRTSKGVWFTVPASQPGWFDYTQTVMEGRIEVSGDRVAVQADLGPVPRAIKTKGAVEIVEYEDWTAYCGTKKALIIEGVCKEKDFPAKYGIRGRIRRQPDETYVCWRLTEEGRRKAEQRQQEEREQKEQAAQQAAEAARKRQETARPLYPFQNVDEYREYIEDKLVAQTRWMLSECWRSMETHHGYRYTLTPAALADVINAIEAAAQTIRDVPVRVERIIPPEVREAARNKAADATSDAAFQRFLGRLPKA